MVMQSECTNLAVALTVEQRERFDELANRDMQLNAIRDRFNQEQWCSNQLEFFYLTQPEQKIFSRIYDCISG
jgi:hypothetical protein